MIERYAPPRIRAVWSDQHRFQRWLQIEILACEAWGSLGRIPADALPRIRAATFDVDRIREVESRVGHDVIAFLTVVGESVGQPEARYLHVGLTSSDVVDTAFALQLRDSADVILEDLGRLRAAAAALAVRHRRTLMAGRTPGAHGRAGPGDRPAGGGAPRGRDRQAQRPGRHPRQRGPARGGARVRGARPAGRPGEHAGGVA